MEASSPPQKPSRLATISMILPFMEENVIYDKLTQSVGTTRLGKLADAAFASGKPACVNVKIAKSDFRKGSISV